MKIIKLLFGILFLVAILGACKYDFIVPEDILVIDPDDPDAPEVSFAADILPIFNNCTACHDTGGQSPDLTTGNAYNSINSNRYINKETPEESKIYTEPAPTGKHPKKYTAAQSALILGWIAQGAKNN